MLTIADGFIILIILVSTIISWIRGFTKEVLSLVAWIGGFLVGFNFCHQLADAFSTYIHTPSVRIAVAFVVLFMVTFLLISLANFCISLLINRIGLSSVDKACGIFVGAARGVLLVSLVLLLLQLTPMSQDPWWNNSFLIPKFVPVENWLKSFMPEYIEKHTVMAD